MDWTKTTFYPAFMPVFLGLIRTPPEQQDFDAIELAVRASGEVLAIPDAHLRNSPWLGGEDFSMGDIPLGPMIYRYFTLPIERPSLPGLEAWFERLSERPAYRKHAMISFGGSLVDWIWGWAVEHPERVDGAVPTSTDRSMALAKELKRRGWRFFGPTTAYAFMQSEGLTNDHDPACFVHDECDAERRAFLAGRELRP